MKNKNQLVVSEVFYSIQGEGPTMGTPAVFLRLAGCNLLCEGAGWRCDTIEVWRKGKSMDFDQVIKEEWVRRLKEGAHLVITGGEPLLHDRGIVAYIEWFKEIYGFKPFIEVETNGTIIPSAFFYNIVEQWNISPKLSNSGEGFVSRYNDEALNFFAKSQSAHFKFVISQEEDFEELLQDFHFALLRTYLMPAGESQEQLSKTRQLTAELAIQCGLKYSDRLHISIWNQKTGV